MRLICLRGRHEIEVHTDDDDADGHCYEHHSDLVSVEEFRRLDPRYPEGDDADG